MASRSGADGRRSGDHRPKLADAYGNDQADFESGKLKEWGAFPGSLGGYSVIEGTEVDVMKFTMQYAPYIAFDVRPLVGAAEVEEFIAAAAGG